MLPFPAIEKNASGVTLEEGATYRLTLDVTAGKDNPVLSLVKK